ncbi:hypothetical protein SY88_09430 [Clostridiales bacterium PH28_bin88]|nr:hypothetical protein SY88_09430 [Clostridiales bacterium PH28_bin88]
MGFLGKIANLVWKDLVTEFRTKEMISSMFIFAFLVILIFAFAFTPTRETTREVFPGIIWLGFTFAGILGLNRSFSGEKDNDALLGLMLAPVDRTAIYFGKVISNLVFMGAMEIISLPLFFILFSFRLEGSLWLLLLVIMLGTLGFITVGTLLAALSANTRTSEILLPLIVFPIVIPVIIAAVKSTGILLMGMPPGEVQLIADFWRWIKLLAVFDVVFLVVPFVLFEYVLEV